MSTSGIMRIGPPEGIARQPPMSDGQVMGWALVGMSMFWPRLFIIGFWIFGHQLGDAFSSWIIPALGFLFLPWTTVAYAFMWGLSSDKVAGAEWVVVAVALLLDIATLAGFRRLSRG